MEEARNEQAPIAQWGPLRVRRWLFNYWLLSGALSIATLALFILIGELYLLIDENKAWGFGLLISFSIAVGAVYALFIHRTLIDPILLFEKKIISYLKEFDIVSSLPEDRSYFLLRLLDGIWSGFDRLRRESDALSDVETHYQSILDTQSEYVFKIDNNGFLTFSNEAFRHITEQGSRDFDEHFLIDDFMMDDVISSIIRSQPDLLATAKTLKQGLDFESEIKGENTSHLIQWKVKHIHSTDEDKIHLNGFLFVGRDITENRMLLQRTKELESTSVSPSDTRKFIQNIRPSVISIHRLCRNLLNGNVEDIDPSTLCLIERVEEESRNSSLLINQFKKTIDRFSSTNMAPYLHSLVEDAEQLIGKSNVKVFFLFDVDVVNLEISEDLLQEIFSSMSDDLNRFKREYTDLNFSLAINISVSPPFARINLDIVPKHDVAVWHYQPLSNDYMSTLLARCNGQFSQRVEERNTHIEINIPLSQSGSVGKKYSEQKL